MYQVSIILCPPGAGMNEPLRLFYESVAYYLYEDQKRPRPDLVVLSGAGKFPTPAYLGAEQLRYHDPQGRIECEEYGVTLDERLAASIALAGKCFPDQECRMSLYCDHLTFLHLRGKIGKAQLIAVRWPERVIPRLSHFLLNAGTRTNYLRTLCIRGLRAQFGLPSA